jgi:hypothetical protein
MCASLRHAFHLFEKKDCGCDGQPTVETQEATIQLWLSILRISVCFQVRVVTADERGAQLCGGAVAGAQGDVFDHVERVLKEGA